VKGELEVKRRRYGDDTLVPKGREHVTPYGTKCLVRKDTKVSSMSLFTRFMLSVTFGRWPFGATAKVPAIKEERKQPRG